MNKQPSSQGNLRMLLRSYTSAAKVFCFPEKKVKALVAQLCPTLCGLMDCSPPGASVPGDSPGQNTGVGGHFLLQGIIPTQGSNPGPSVLCLLVLWLWGESRRASASSLCSFVVLSPPEEPISTSVLHFSLKHHLSIPFQVHHALPETCCF